MMIQKVYGHLQNVLILDKAIEKNRVAHAYLFSGPEGIGKSRVAHYFIGNLFCINKREEVLACGECTSCKKLIHDNHPDFYLVEPMGTRIKIEQIRQLQKTFHYKSYEAPYKVYVIKDAEVMTTEAANSLLKILEEPPVETVFILITTKPHAMLPTIHSRCQHVNFQKLRLEDVIAYLMDSHNLNKEQAGVIANLADGSLLRAESMATSNEISEKRNEIMDLMRMVMENDQIRLIRTNNDWEKRKEEFPLALELLELFYRDILIMKEIKNINLVLNKDEIEFLQEMTQFYRDTDITHTILRLEELRKQLSQNVNFKLILDNLFIVLKAG